MSSDRQDYLPVPADAISDSPLTIVDVTSIDLHRLDQFLYRSLVSRVTMQTVNTNIS